MSRVRIASLVVAVALGVFVVVFATRPLHTPGLQRWSCGTAINPLYLEPDGGFPKGKNFRSCRQVVDSARLVAGTAFAAAVMLTVVPVVLSRLRRRDQATFGDLTVGEAH